MFEDSALIEKHVYYIKVEKSFEMLCWRSMEKISWTDGLINDIESTRRIISYIKQKNGRLLGNILRINCLLKDVIEGTIEGRI